MRTETTQRLIDYGKRAGWLAVLRPILDSSSMTKLRKLASHFEDDAMPEEVDIDAADSLDAGDAPMTREQVYQWFTDKATEQAVQAMLDEQSESTINRLAKSIGWPLYPDRLVQNAAELYFIGNHAVTREQAHALAVERFDGTQPDPWHLYAAMR